MLLVMRVDICDDEILRKALAIYIDEFRRHIDVAERIFHSEASPKQEDLEAAAIMFHTIKGGAGFFGLKDIQDKARQIEDLIAEQRTNLLQKQDVIRRELEALQRIAASMLIDSDL